MTGIATLLSAVLLLAAPSVPAAAADDVADARAHFRRGAELYRAKRYRDAAAEFETAYRIKPHGAIHYNLAQCHDRLGEWPLALASYQDYLRELPDAPDRAAVRAAMQRVEARIGATGVQALLVYSDPPGADVRIEGRVRGQTPFHLLLPPGPYTVGIRLDGHAPVEEELTLTVASARVVDVVLRPVTPGEGSAAVAAATAIPTATAPPAAITTAMTTPTPTPASTAPRASSAIVTAIPTATAPPAAITTAMTPPTATRASTGLPPATATAASTPDLSPRPRSPLLPAAPGAPPAHRRVYTWVAGGAGVAALAVGAYLGNVAHQKSASLRDGTVRTGDENRALARDASTAARNANILYGLAGAAGAAGVTLFWWEGRF